MTRTLRYFLRGVGSVLDIYPDTAKFSRIVPKKNADERMRQAWDDTGKQIRNAVRQFADGQKQK